MMFEEDLRRSPTCLIVPGLGNSGPGHWQTLWEQERADCRRVELGCWDTPVRNVWIGRIDQAVRAAGGPVILVAHSLGCIAVAWWAGLLGQDVTSRVAGALLVAPPDVDRCRSPDVIARFAPTPLAPLPFPALVVASTDDPYCRRDRAADMASAWLADLVLLDDLGHINAGSGLGRWSEGQALLDRLMEGDVRRRATARAPIVRMVLPKHATMR
ncbi:alpha/beta hydrolase [Sphingomonas sp. BIUV-7]|uniref:Alpha/beta hydrolase n=1 Tax=Sphingomonas natans TaxID=3063330 RepID=A0ABT8Y8U8_9SPHN|nr:alpha/beta hydrolase [Sphingomonas sp. BIUV-7]MDO6414755.1 alpha/beta hydrolase [Sphingomonas sp. BIUV-7]